jgi:acyl dehydratase
MTITSLDGLVAAVGTDLPPPTWRAIELGRIDGFADVTDDHQCIHVDAEKAASGPFGGTIAHGFLVLVLLAPFFNEVIDPSDADSRINDGFDRVRLTLAVPVGSRIRARFYVTAVLPRGSMQEVRLHADVEVEGSERRAVIADMIRLLHPVPVPVRVEVPL